MERPIADALRAEVVVLEEAGVFARSPVLWKLLTYLVEETAKGRGAALKSYTIAVEGLGRDPAFDAQYSTYSRVLVARLRATLDEFYRKEGAGRPYRLTIPQGIYEMRLEPNEVQVSSPDAGQAKPAAIAPRSKLAIAIGVIVAILFAAWTAFASRAESKRWQENDFPTVIFTRGATASHALDSALMVAEHSLKTSLRSYESARIIADNKAATRYEVQLDELIIGSSSNLIVSVKDRKDNREIYSKIVNLSKNQKEILLDDLEFRRLAYEIFGQSGALTARERQNNRDSDSPYKCWLRFTRHIGLNASLPDHEFEQCAQSWHHYWPQSRIGASLYAWSLADQAIRAPTRASADQKLRQAAQVIFGAVPEEAPAMHAWASLARIYALSGNDAALREIAKTSRESAQTNPDLANVIGTMLVLRNDHSGMELIDTSFRINPNPPSRYYTGRFVAAMMNDDIKGAGMAVEQGQAERRDQLWPQIFEAAYLARTGKVGAARVVWQRLTTDRPFLRLNPQAALQRSPAAPAVQARLLEWLAPVID